LFCFVLFCFNKGRLISVLNSGTGVVYVVVTPKKGFVFMVNRRKGFCHQDAFSIAACVIGPGSFPLLIPLPGGQYLVTDLYHGQAQM
jgi:hypothetical protein